MSDERKQVIEWAIACSLRSITQDEWKVLTEFLTDYLRTHLYFVGDDVLGEFRRQGRPYADRDWRNRWGGLLNHLRAEGYIEVVGKTRPTHNHSHIGSICSYRSRYYSATAPLAPPRQGSLL